MWSAVYRHPDSACYCHYHAHTHTKDREITCTIYCLIDAMSALLVNVWHFITVLAAAVWLYQLFCFRLPVKCQFNTMIGSSITTLGRESNFSRKAFLWLIISFYGKLFFSASHTIIWINLKRSNKAEINYWESCLKNMYFKTESWPCLAMQTLLSHHHAVSVCALPWKVTGRRTHTPYSSSWPPKKQSWLRYSPLPKVHTHIHAHNERGKRTKREGAFKTVETRYERLPVTKEIWRCFFSAFTDVIIHVSVCYVLLCASAIKLKQWHFYSKVCSFFFCHIGVTFSSKKHTYLYLFFFSLIHFHLFSLCIILLQRDQTPSWSAL